VDTTRPQRKRTTQEHLGKISGAGNVGGRLQVLLGEDGDRVDGFEWSLAYAPLAATRHKSVS